MKKYKGKNIEGVIVNFILPNMSSNLYADGLDLEEIYDLKFLESIEINDNCLTILDISNCPNLISLVCYNNKIKKIDITKCKKLKHLICDKDVIIDGLDEFIERGYEELTLL